MTSIRTQVFNRLFRCTICDARRTAPKKFPTKLGHHKHMYCYKCKAERKFEQIG